MIDGNDVIIAYKNGSIIDAHFKKQKLTPDKSDDFESKNLTKLGDDQLKFTFSRKIKTDDTDHDTNLNQLKGIFIIEKNGRKVEKPKELDFTSLKEFQQSSKFETLLVFAALPFCTFFMKGLFQGSLSFFVKAFF